MKPLIVFFALVIQTLALPCAAQVSQTQGRPSSQTPQALAQGLLLHRVSGHGPQTPLEKARVEAMMARIDDLRLAGMKALQIRDFIAAEVTFRSLIEADPFSPDAHYSLGDAIVGQGRIADAIAEYRIGIYWPSHMIKPKVAGLNDAVQAGRDRPILRFHPTVGAATSWMECALLLSQTGQEAEAIAIYNQALPSVPEADHPGLSLTLSSAPLTPETFQSAAHVALGLCATFGPSEPDKALSEFETAQRLRPDLPLTNYYYGYGWQRLDPNSPVKKASAASAKAALLRAAASDDGEVKKAAGEALARLK